MSEYHTYKVRLTTTGQVIETMAKDGIEARAILADLYGVEYDQTELV